MSTLLDQFDQSVEQMNSSTNPVVASIRQNVDAYISSPDVQEVIREILNIPVTDDDILEAIKIEAQRNADEGREALEQLEQIQSNNSIIMDRHEAVRAALLPKDVDNLEARKVYEKILNQLPTREDFNSWINKSVQEYIRQNVDLASQATNQSREKVEPQVLYLFLTQFFDIIKELTENKSPLRSRQLLNLIDKQTETVQIIRQLMMDNPNQKVSQIVEDAKEIISAYDNDDEAKTDLVQSVLWPILANKTVSLTENMASALRQYIKEKIAQGWSAEEIKADVLERVSQMINETNMKDVVPVTEESTRDTFDRTIMQAVSKSPEVVIIALRQIGTNSEDFNTDDVLELIQYPYEITELSSEKVGLTKSITDPLLMSAYRNKYINDDDLNQLGLRAEDLIMSAKVK